MHRISFLVFGLALLISLPARSQNYTGSFTASNDQGGQTVVSLMQSGQIVTGTMSGLGNTFQIEGELEEGSVVGVMTIGQEGGLWFEAELDESILYFTLVEPTATGEPNFDTATTLMFTRVGDDPTAGSGKTAGGAVVLGEELAEEYADDYPTDYGEPQMQGQAPAQQPRQQPGSPSGIHDGTPQAIEWANWLANMKATQMESYSSGSAGGYSSRADYHLCANGRFFMSDQSTVSVDVGGAYGYSGGSGSGAGTWRVITQGQLVGIELRYNNGEVSQHRLEYDYENSATYIDGSRWYITQTDQCGY